MGIEEEDDEFEFVVFIENKINSGEIDQFFREKVIDVLETRGVEIINVEIKEYDLTYTKGYPYVVFKVQGKYQGMEFEYDDEKVFFENESDLVGLEKETTNSELKSMLEEWLQLDEDKDLIESLDELTDEQYEEIEEIEDKKNELEIEIDEVLEILKEIVEDIMEGCMGYKDINELVENLYNNFKEER